jgi:hypothetical protein
VQSALDKASDAYREFNAFTEDSKACFGSDVTAAATPAQANTEAAPIVHKHAFDRGARTVRALDKY